MPSPCVETRRVVFEFLDDELGEPQVVKIVEHLERCPPCKGFFAFERTFLSVVRRRVSVDEAPPELRERIQKALADRKRSSPTA